MLRETLKILACHSVDYKERLYEFARDNFMIGRVIHLSLIKDNIKLKEKQEIPSLFLDNKRIYYKDYRNHKDNLRFISELLEKFDIEKENFKIKLK